MFSISVILTLLSSSAITFASPVWTTPVARVPAPAAAAAQSWLRDQGGGDEPQSPAPSRTYHPTSVVGSIPSSQIKDPHSAQTETILKARINDILNKRSSYNHAGTATTLPSNFPTTLATSSSYTTSASAVVWNPFWPTDVLGVATVSATETDYEIYTARPTSFPHSVTCYHIRTASTTQTVYHISKQGSYPPWYCALLPSTTLAGVSPEICSSYTSPVPVILGTSGTFTDIHTDTSTYTRIWYFSVTSFPSTITKVYTSSRTSLLTTTHSWDFGGGPFRTRTTAPAPDPTAGSESGSGSESNGPEIGIYNITYIEVATIVEEWKTRPSTLPYTLTQTAEVTQSEVFTYMDGGLTVTAMRSETTYPTLVVGEIKQLPISGIENRTWEYKGW